MSRVPPLLVCIALTMAFLVTLATDRTAPAWSRPEEGAVQAPPGYRVSLVADGLSNPTALAAGDDGALFVAQAGDGGPNHAIITLIGPGIEGRVITQKLETPITGLTWWKGALYATHRGAISVVRPATGEVRPLLADLPDLGDHPATGVAVGPDGKLYFGLGTATNAAVVEPGNAWLRRIPTLADLPCQSLKLRGVNFSTANPLTPDPHDKATTGAFQPFGVPTSRGQVVPAALPCTGALLRVASDGSHLELVAWGLRAPTAPAFDEAGRLWVATRGMANVGSRPVQDDPDALYQVEPGAWYGWPDFTNDGRALNALLLEHPWSRREAAALLPPGAAPAALLFPPHNLGLQGDALIALTGSSSVVRVTPQGRVTPFLATRPEKRGIARPIALAAGPDGSVYVLDQGPPAAQGRPDGTGEQQPPGQGALWRISRAPTSGIHMGNRFRWALVGAVSVCLGAILMQSLSSQLPKE